MRWGRVALAVVFLAWAGGAIASPLIPTVSGVSLTSHREVKTVPWCHRHHRGSFWGERGEADRDASDDSARGLTKEDISLPEIVRPTLVVVPIGVVPGAGGAAGLATSPETSLSASVVRTVSRLLRLHGPMGAVAADGSIPLPLNR